MWSNKKCVVVGLMFGLFVSVAFLLHALPSALASTLFVVLAMMAVATIYGKTEDKAWLIITTAASFYFFSLGLFSLPIVGLVCALVVVPVLLCRKYVAAFNGEIVFILILGAIATMYLGSTVAVPYVFLYGLMYALLYWAVVGICWSVLAVQNLSKSA